MGTIEPAGKPNAKPSKAPIIISVGGALVAIFIVASIAMKVSLPKQAAVIGDRTTALMYASDAPADAARESREVAEAYIKACLVSDAATQQRLAPGLGHPIVFSAKFVREADRRKEDVTPDGSFGAGWFETSLLGVGLTGLADPKEWKEAERFKAQHPVLAGILLLGGGPLPKEPPTQPFTVYAYGYVYDVELQSQAGTKLSKRMALIVARATGSVAVPWSVVTFADI